MQNKICYNVIKKELTLDSNLLQFKWGTRGDLKVFSIQPSIWVLQFRLLSKPNR